MGAENRVGALFRKTIRQLETTKFNYSGRDNREMARTPKPWYRFYTEAISDRKLRRMSPAARWVWVAALSAARESPQPGRLLLAEGEPMTVSDLADYAGALKKNGHEMVTVALRLQMLHYDGETLVVTHWGDRQFEADNVTARTQRHRDKAKREEGLREPDVEVPHEGTFLERSKERSNDVRGNVLGTPPETETDTDEITDVISLGATAPKTTKRGARLDPSWLPDETVRAAMTAELPGFDFSREHKRFIDYWIAQPGQKGVKLDWAATWRNWMRKAAEKTHLPASGVARSISPTARGGFNYEETMRRYGGKGNTPT